MNDATLKFIRQHRNDDVRTLALKAHGQAYIDLPCALDQIAGWQTARHKLPSWAAIEGLRYPPHLSMEQCSSEKAARYKATQLQRLLKLSGTSGASGLSRLSESPTLVDLTGGFGVDFSFLSRDFAKAIYVEQQPHLCDTARHNFPLLGLANTDIVCADAIDYLRQMEPATVIFLDPARRNAHGQRTFAISDCTPDVTALRDELAAKAEWTLVKLSPMLDWHKAVDDLSPLVREVHIVAIDGECKELLLVLSQQHEQPLHLFCECDGNSFICEPLSPPMHFGGILAAASLPSPLSPFEDLREGLLLFDPNSAIMKAGCFDHVASAFRLSTIAPNSHLFLAPAPSEQSSERENNNILLGGDMRGAFPGRRFRILSITTMNKKDLRQALQGLTRANIAVRNFPMTADDLRRRLKLSDGGDTYIFGTTTADNRHLLLVCRKC